MHPIFATSDAQAVPIWFANTGNLSAVTAKIGGAAGAFAKAAGFEAKPGQYLMMPGGGGKLAAVLFGLENEKDGKKDLFLPGKLANILPDGTYRFANAPHDARLAALAFALGAYEFARYRKPFAGPVIANHGFDRTTGNAIIEAGIADAVSYARAFIANPDLVSRFALGHDLAAGDPGTYYTGGARGYVDYPAWPGSAPYA